MNMKIMWIFFICYRNRIAGEIFYTAKARNNFH